MKLRPRLRTRRLARTRPAPPTKIPSASGEMPISTSPSWTKPRRSTGSCN